MKLTDEQIKRAYAKATNNRPMATEGTEQARAFISAIFDELSPAGYTDGVHFAEEEWELENPVAVYRRPE